MNGVAPAELSPGVQRKLTLTEIGVIASLAISTASGIFTLGVVYGQVQRNTADIDQIKPKVDDMRERVARIDEGVRFLTERSRENTK